jgi:hypothetical protein
MKLEQKLNKEEVELIKKSTEVFKNGITYNSKKNEYMKDDLLKQYVEHNLQSYRHFKKYGDNHYLK